jgi:NAD(P)-dependent dehydrogenase (short-subunit alcohol dehydrogenase family)
MSAFPNLPLSGTHVVIVGGSAGIGLATAAAAKAKGATVMLIGRNAERLERASASLGGAATAVANILERAQIEAAFETMARVDHLVVTAGSLQAGTVAESEPDFLLRAIDERIKGALYAVKAALPRMPPVGSIVLTGGQYSDRPAPRGVALTAAGVSGIEGLARALALELKPIRVNVVAPGLIDTGLFDGLGPQLRTSIFRTATDTLPVGRAGTADEVADAIMFLLTNGYMDGEVLHIDGGGRLI